MNRSAIINVVIDERKQLEQLDDVAFYKSQPPKKLNNTATRRVFRDYILSSEPFPLESSLN